MSTQRRFDRYHGYQGCVYRPMHQSPSKIPWIPRVCVSMHQPPSKIPWIPRVCIHAPAPFKDTMDTKAVYTCISPLPRYHGYKGCVYMHQPLSKIPWIPRVCIHASAPFQDTMDTKAVYTCTSPLPRYHGYQGCVYMHQPPSKIPWIPRVCIHASPPFHDTMDAKGVYTCISPLPRYHGYRVCVSTRYHGYQGCVYRHQHHGTIACQHNNNIDLIDTMDTKGVCIGLYISPLPSHHEYQVCELMHQPPTPHPTTPPPPPTLPRYHGYQGVYIYASAPLPNYYIVLWWWATMILFTHVYIKRQYGGDASSHGPIQGDGIMQGVKTWWFVKLAKLRFRNKIPHENILNPLGKLVWNLNPGVRAAWSHSTNKG